MNYVGKISVSYTPKLTRLERLRLVDAEFDNLTASLNHSDQLWLASSRSQDERRDACTAVAASLFQFASSTGISNYARERMNDLLVALGELQCGRKSVLFAPAPVHPGKFSATDLQQQAVAQVCVDVLRDAGMSATDARAKVSGLFEKHQLPKFGEAKLRALNSRLRGPGCTQDEAYDLYVWAKEHFARTAVQMGVDPTESVGKASKVANILVALSKRRDHRRDFFFASREDSSEMP